MSDISIDQNNQAREAERAVLGGLMLETHRFDTVIQVINETDFRIRNGIEKWMSGINDLETSTGVTDPALYYSTLRVEQLDRDNNLLKSYEMKNCWPTAISAIELSYDTVSEVETFDVTWRYTDFTASSV